MSYTSGESYGSFSSGESSHEGDEHGDEDTYSGSGSVFGGGEEGADGAPAEDWEESVGLDDEDDVDEDDDAGDHDDDDEEDEDGDDDLHDMDDMEDVLDGEEDQDELDGHEEDEEEDEDDVDGDEEDEDEMDQEDNFFEVFQPFGALVMNDLVPQQGGPGGDGRHGGNSRVDASTRSLAAQLGATTSTRAADGVGFSPVDLMPLPGLGATGFEPHRMGMQAALASADPSLVSVFSRVDPRTLMFALGWDPMMAPAGDQPPADFMALRAQVAAMAHRGDIGGLLRQASGYDDLDGTNSPAAPVDPSTRLHRALCRPISTAVASFPPRRPPTSVDRSHGEPSSLSAVYRNLSALGIVLPTRASNTLASSLSRGGGVAQPGLLGGELGSAVPSLLPSSRGSAPNGLSGLSTSLTALAHFGPGPFGCDGGGLGRSGTAAGDSNTSPGVRRGVERLAGRWRYEPPSVVGHTAGVEPDEPTSTDVATPNFRAQPMHSALTDMLTLFGDADGAVLTARDDASQIRQDLEEARERAALEVATEAERANADAMPPNTAQDQPAMDASPSGVPQSGPQPMSTATDEGDALAAHVGAISVVSPLASPGGPSAATSNAGDDLIAATGARRGAPDASGAGPDAPIVPSTEPGAGNASASAAPQVNPSGAGAVANAVPAAPSGPPASDAAPLAVADSLRNPPAAIVDGDFTAIGLARAVVAGISMSAPADDTPRVIEAATEATGVDPTFLSALPSDMRLELLNGLFTSLSAIRMMDGVVGSAGSGAPNAASRDPSGRSSAAVGNNNVRARGEAGRETSAPAVQADAEARSVVAVLGATSLNPDFLAALPPDLRGDALAEEARYDLEQHNRRGSEAGGSAGGAGAGMGASGPGGGGSNGVGDMDNATFLATLAPTLREEILVTSDAAFLATLPPVVAAEARVLRQRALRQQRARLAAHTWTDGDGRVREEMDAGIPMVSGVDVVSVDSGMLDARAAYGRRRGQGGARDGNDADDGIFEPPPPLPHLDAAALGAVVRLLTARDAPRTMVHRVLTGTCRVPAARDAVLSVTLDLAEARATGSLSASAEFRGEHDGSSEGGSIKMQQMVLGLADESADMAVSASRGPRDQLVRPKVKVMAAKSESADPGVVVRRSLELLHMLAKDNEDVARALAAPTAPVISSTLSSSPATPGNSSGRAAVAKRGAAARAPAAATAPNRARPPDVPPDAVTPPPFMARLVALLTSRLLRRSIPTIELLLSLLSTVCHAIPPAGEGGRPGADTQGNREEPQEHGLDAFAAVDPNTRPPSAAPPRATEQRTASDIAEARPSADASATPQSSLHAASPTAELRPTTAAVAGNQAAPTQAAASVRPDDAQLPATTSVDAAAGAMQDQDKIVGPESENDAAPMDPEANAQQDADPAAARVPRIADKDVRALVDVVRRAGCSPRGYIRASGVLARLGERRAHEQVAVAALCEAVLATGARVASTLDYLVSRIHKVAGQPGENLRTDPRGAVLSSSPSVDNGASGAESASKHSPAVSMELRRFADSPASDSELALLRLLVTLDSLIESRRAAAAADPQVSDTGVTSAAALGGLQHLWNVLTSLLDAIRGKDVGSDDEDDETRRTAAARAVATVGSRPKGARSALPPALARLAPLIEAYFRAQSVLHSRSTTGPVTSTAGAVSPGTAAASSPPTASAGSVGSVDTPAPLVLKESDGGAATASGEGDEAAQQTTQLGTFINRHRAAVNAVIRANPSLLDGSLRSALSHPQALDFDNKRTYFRTLVRKRLSTEASASGGVSPLRIRVRRDQVFQDSYHQLRMRSASEMKGRLHVQFIGEEGIDAGGVTREWYALLARKIFDANHALFVKSAAKSATYQPNVVSYVNEDHLGVFKFAGRVFGKAILDGQLLDAYFTRAFYKHLLGVKPSFSDVEALDPDLHSSLTWVLNNDPAVLDMTMSAEHTEFGTTDVVDLIPNGRNIPVTNANKSEYVRLITDLRLTKAIRRQIDAFLSGFRELIPAADLTMFNEVELELLMAGLPDIDVADLKGNVEYTGYTRSSPQVDWFWTFVSQLGREDLARLVMFVTGTSKIPIEGFAALQGMNGPQKFHIHRVSCASGPHFPLPSAHTCFNTLDLPQYPSAEILSKQLLCAIREGSEGFGFA
ncbi:hypothetical protein MMPV_009183 [Pyropia vietnamensis]